MSITVSLLSSHALAADVSWTNTTASGNFTNASNWNPIGVPGGNDTASFTNSATYTVSGFTNILNSSVFVGAFKVGTAGSLTLNVGSGNTWTLTNAFHIATNSANTAANGITVILSSGTLAVTNSAGTGLLNIGEVGTGTFILNGGALVVSSLMATGTAGKSTLTLTSGTLTTLNGSAISNNATFNIGSSGPVTWNMLGGTNRIFLTAGNNVNIGSSGASAGSTVIVTGTSTVWTNNNDIMVGPSASSAALIVSNGAAVFCAGMNVGTVSTGAKLIISNGAMVASTSGIIGNAGNAASTMATVLVMSAGSIWTNSGDLTIGGGAGTKNNALTIASGGKVFNVNATVGTGGNNGAGSGNSATVTDGGSSWMNLGTLTIGSAQGGGSCFVVVSNGAGLVSSYALVGGGAAGNDSATVTGGGSVWTNLNTLSVGASGGGFNGLVVSSGGKVFTADSVIGTGSADNNTGLVSGAGSGWNNTGTFVVGATTLNNTLTVTNAGLVTAANVFLGTNSASTGNRVIVAAGSLFATNSSNTGRLVVGLLGQGTFSFNGGTVTVDQLIVTNNANINRFIFNGGTLNTRNSTVTNGFAFVVGDGATAAVLNLVGGTHLFFDGLTNSAGATITGGGVVRSRFQVANLGSIVATSTVAELQFTNATTVGNGATLGAATGATLTFGTAGIGSAVITNFGTLSMAGGTFRSGNITNLANGFIGGSGVLAPLLVNSGAVTATNGELRLLGAVSGAGAYRAVAGTSVSTLSFVGGGSLSALYNTGATIRVEGVLTNTSVFVNAGTLALMGGTYYSAANLTNPVGAFIVDQGTLNAPLINLGSMLVTNGTLLLPTGLTNASTGSINISSGATLSVTPIWANLGTVDVSGGVLAGSANITNASTGLIRGFGTVTNTTLINSGTIFANSATALSFDSARVVNSGIVTADAGGLIVRGTFVNSGTVAMQHSVGTFNNVVVNSGRWITDPSTNVFVNDYTNTATGVISMSAGDVYIFTTNTGPGSTVGSFVDSSTNNAANDKLSGKFLFGNHTLSLTQNFYAAGHDMNQGQATSATNQITVLSLSPLPAGYVTNFSLGTLEIANFSTVRVWDAFSNIGPGTDDNLRAALYVTNLLMSANSYLIIGSNVSVYFLTSNSWGAANFDLLGGPVLANQGQLHQFALSVVPEPGVLFLWLSGVATLYAARRRQNRSRTARR